MLQRYKPSPTSSRVAAAVLGLSLALGATPAFSQDTPAIDQPMFGTLTTDGWALEIHDPATDGSIFVPVNNMIDGHMRAIMESISQAEETPIDLYTLQPQVEVYLYDTESSSRLEAYDFESSIVPLTPCPWGYCLPPWLLDAEERLESSGVGADEYSVPVVNFEDIQRYLQLID